MQDVFFLTFDFTIILFKALGQCDSRPLSIDFVRFTFLTSPRSQYLDFFFPFAPLLFDIVFQINLKS